MCSLEKWLGPPVYTHNSTPLKLSKLSLSNIELGQKLGVPPRIGRAVLNPNISIKYTYNLDQNQANKTSSVPILLELIADKMNRYKKWLWVLDNTLTGCEQENSLMINYFVLILSGGAETRTLPAQMAGLEVASYIIQLLRTITISSFIINKHYPGYIKLNIHPIYKVGDMLLRILVCWNTHNTSLL